MNAKSPMNKALFLIGLFSLLPDACIFASNSVDTESYEVDEPLIVSAPHCVNSCITYTVKEFNSEGFPYSRIKSHYVKFIFAQNPTYKEMAEAVRTHIKQEGELVLYYSRQHKNAKLYKRYVTETSEPYDKYEVSELDFVTHDAQKLREQNRTSLRR